MTKNTGMVLTSPTWDEQLKEAGVVVAHQDWGAVYLRASELNRGGMALNDAIRRASSEMGGKTRLERDLEPVTDQ